MARGTRNPSVRKAPTNGHGVAHDVGLAAKLTQVRIAESGITIAQATRLGLAPVANAANLHPLFHPRPALRIPYWHPDDPAKPLTGWPRLPPFYRLRYLGDEPPGPNRQTKGKSIKYVQPPNTPSCAYFPRLDFEWGPILDNPTHALVVTEGELKAAKACIEHFDCIGLGGVWSFQSTDWGVDLLPELRRVNWVKRPLYLVYDSDARTNPQVVLAARMLGERFMMMGARPHYICLPDALDGGAKTGLDDYLVRAGAKAFEDLLADAKPYTLAAPLWEFNERHLYVFNPGLVLHTTTNQRMARQQFTDAYSNADFHERVVDDNGDFKLRRVNAAKAWMGWPMRRQVDCLTYAPGQPVDVIVKGEAAHNIWPGWGVVPVKGDIGPYLDLVDHLFTGASRGDVEWFHDWWAYGYQHPGIKMYSALVIHGKSGTGKSMLGEIHGRIHGENYKLIGPQDLHASFNGWMEARTFIHGDEIQASDRRQDADMLKNMITQRTVDINIKYVPSYTIPDCINYMFTSNHPDAFFLSDEDRRFFVHEVTVKPAPDEFYDRIKAWKDGEGPAALFHWLLHRKLSEFSPTSHARRTAAKERMTAFGKSDLGAWVAQLKEHPDSVLRVGGLVAERAIWSSSELHELYDPEGKKRASAVALGRELSRAGFGQVLNGKPLRWTNGTHEEQGRYFAVRDADRWLKATAPQLRAYMEGRPEPASRRKK